MEWIPYECNYGVCCWVGVSWSMVLVVTFKASDVLLLERDAVILDAE